MIAYFVAFVEWIKFVFAKVCFSALSFYTKVFGVFK